MAKLFFKYHPSKHSVCDTFSLKKVKGYERSQTKQSCQLANHDRAHFSPQWQHYQEANQIILIENKKTAQKNVFLYLSLQSTQAALLMRKLRIYNRQNLLQKMLLENTQWQQSLLWLNLFNLRRKQWWQFLLLKKYRKHRHAWKKRLKRKKFFLDRMIHTTDSAVMEKTHKHPNTFKKTGLFWLKHLQKKTALIIQKRKSYPFFN